MGTKRYYIALSRFGGPFNTIFGAQFIFMIFNFDSCMFLYCSAFSLLKLRGELCILISRAGSEVDIILK